MTTTIAQITSIVKAAIEQNKQFILSDATFDSLPLGGLMSLLNTPQLHFERVIDESETSLTIAGQSSILGADNITIEAKFSEADGVLAFSVSAKEIQSGHVPGTDWLTIRQGQIALQVTGQAHEIMGTLSGTIQAGDVEIANAVFEVGKQAENVVLHWAIAQLNLSQIAGAFLGGATLPIELPIFSFKDVQTTIALNSGAFSFEVHSADAWDFPAGGGGLSITEVNLKLDRESHNSQTTCTINIKSQVNKEIVAGLAIAGFQLAFDYQGSEWSVLGGVDAILFDESISLAAGYSQKPSGKTLTLTAHSDMKPLDLGEIGKFSVSALELEFTKSANAEAALEWSVLAAGTISIVDVLESTGKLSIYKQADTAGLLFEPDTAQVTIHLPPDQQALLELDFAGISIVRQSNTDNTKEWKFTASVNLSFENWNARVQKYLPAHPIAMKLEADKRSVTLSVDGAIEAIQFTIPNVEISSYSLELGTADIEISNLDIQLGKQIELSAVLGVGLPSQLNNLFGEKKDGNGNILKDADGKPIPVLEFFRTLDIHDPEKSTVQLQLSISEAGIKLTPETSFIKAIELLKGEDGKPYWHGEFGEFGAINVDVPEFSYNATNSSFAASGGFDVVRPLALPLTPIKHLLEGKFKGAADILPDSLPLTDLEINADNFVDQLTQMLEKLLAKIGSGKLSNEAKQVLEAIAKNFHDLPDSFREYLNIKIPQSFKFDVAVTPEGSVRFDASVKPGDPPIKLLFAGVLGIIPVLNGVTLRSISFGATAGGSLFLLNIDAEVDQFDLATLAAAIALPEIPNNPLPSTQKLQRRLRLNNVTMILPTEFPIPVPVFYENLGIEYLGLEGLTFQTHAQFPTPAIGLQGVGQLLSNLKDFFTKRDFKLDPKTPPQGLEKPLFSLNQNYIQLPQYLGGQTLGSLGNGPALEYKDVANFLNALKTLSINDLIQAYPLAQRIGSTSISFGAFNSSLGWLVTTPNEFRKIIAQSDLKQLAYSRLSLTSDAQATSILTVLPTTVNEEGMVVFLRGNSTISNLASFETVFGLAASQSLGFQTGFQMVGKVSDVIALGLGGRVVIASKSDRFHLEGNSYLKVLNQDVFTGDVQISDRGFQSQGSLNLYGLGGSVALSIDRDRGADIHGELNAINLGVFQLTGVNGKPNPSVSLQIQPNQPLGMNVAGAVQLLGLHSETQISVNENNFLFSTSGNLFNRFSCNLKASGKRLSDRADFRVSATMQSDLFQFLKTEATKVIKQEADKAQALISGFQKKVDDAQAEVNRLQGVVDQQRAIVQGERTTAQRKFDAAQADVNSATRKVNSLNDDINNRQRELNSIPQRCKWGICVSTDPVRFARLQTEIKGLQLAIEGAKQALTIAQQGLELARKGLVNTPIDIDPRVAGPLVSLKSATEGLTAAKQTLELTKRGVAAAASASDYITRFGADALVQVNSSSFEADLNTASGGQVTLAVSLTYMGKPLNTALNFNFNNPVDSAQALGQLLLGK